MVRSSSEIRHPCSAAKAYLPSSTDDSQDTLFGRSLTPAERLRQHQRSLQKAQRELEREKGKLEAQEKKTMADIKKNAKAGNMVSLVHRLARDIDCGRGKLRHSVSNHLGRNMYLRRVLMLIRTLARS